MLLRERMCTEETSSWTIEYVSYGGPVVLFDVDDNFAVYSRFAELNYLFYKFLCSGVYSKKVTSIHWIDKRLKYQWVLMWCCYNIY